MAENTLGHDDEPSRLAARAWTYPVGTPVRVARVEKPSFESVTRSAAWNQGSAAMIMVEGIHGPCTLDRVTVRGELPAAPVPTLRVFWTDPAEEGPAMGEIPITTSAVGYWTIFLPDKRVILPHECRAFPAGKLVDRFERAFPAHDLLVPPACLVYVEAAPGRWEGALVEATSQRLRRLEAQLASLSR